MALEISKTQKETDYSWLQSHKISYLNSKLVLNDSTIACEVVFDLSYSYLIQVFFFLSVKLLS